MSEKNILKIILQEHKERQLSTCTPSSKSSKLLKKKVDILAHFGF